MYAAPPCKPFEPSRLLTHSSSAVVQIYKGGVDPTLAGLTPRGEAADDAEEGEDDDVSGWLDKARDELSREPVMDNVELFLFQTAALVLEQLSKLHGLEQVPPQVVGFFFRSLELASTLASQRCAAVCCALLSHAHLNALVNAYFEMQRSVKEGRFRWLLYQQAMQMLAFGVSTSQQARHGRKGEGGGVTRGVELIKGHRPRCAPRSATAGGRTEWGQRAWPPRDDAPRESPPLGGRRR